jgi:membrane protease YdiL (CAAX protease family)
MLAVLLAGFLVACGAVAVVEVASAFGDAVGIDLDFSSTPLVDNLLALVGLALITPLVLVVVRLVQRRPAGTMHSVAGRIRWQWLAMCTALAFVFAALLIVGLLWMYDGFGEPLLTISWKRFLAVGALLLVLVPLQAAGEEYLSRGLLLQSLGAYHRWIGVLGSALFFAAMHGFGTWPGFAALFLGGVVWAMLVIKTGGLEVSVAAHATTNLLAFLLGAASGQLDVVDETTATDAPLGVALLSLGVGLGYALAVLLLLRMLARHRPRLVPAARSIASQADEQSTDVVGATVRAGASPTPSQVRH